MESLSEEVQSMFYPDEKELSDLMLGGEELTDLIINYVKSTKKPSIIGILKKFETYLTISKRYVKQYFKINFRNKTIYYENRKEDNEFWENVKKSKKFDSVIHPFDVIVNILYYTNLDNKIKIEKVLV